MARARGSGGLRRQTEGPCGRGGEGQAGHHSEVTEPAKADDTNFASAPVERRGRFRFDPRREAGAYEKLIATDPTIERKGATIPYTSANGKMFTYLSPTGDLRLRLPPDEREAFMKKYKTKVVVQHGVVMKDFVAVPPGLLARTSELKKYLAISRDFAKQLGTKRTSTRARC